MEDMELSYYLEDLNRIHELSLEKLGEWKEKYPYSQVVHFLMAKKHQVEGFVDDMSIYHKASFYAVDREFLQERMTNSELEAGIHVHDEMQVELTDNGEDILKDAELEMPAQIRQKSEEAAEPILPSEEKLSDFAQWLVSLGGQDSSVQEKSSAVKKKKKKKKKKSKLERKIEESVVKKDEIISEALASILAQQGHKEKAADMYRKLSLIFPEKSSFFALQIEKLK